MEDRKCKFRKKKKEGESGKNRRLREERALENSKIVFNEGFVRFMSFTT